MSRYDRIRERDNLASRKRAHRDRIAGDTALCIVCGRAYLTHGRLHVCSSTCAEVLRHRQHGS